MASGWFPLAFLSCSLRAPGHSSATCGLTSCPRAYPLCGGAHYRHCRLRRTGWRRGRYRKLTMIASFLHLAVTLFLHSYEPGNHGQSRESGMSHAVVRNDSSAFGIFCSQLQSVQLKRLNNEKNTIWRERVDIEERS